MPEDMPEDIPEDMPDRMPEDMSEYMPEDMPDRMPEDMSDRMPEDMPDRMPEDLPDRMPEDMSDRMPEDLPVRKCKNVTVGITRSKVITSKCASRHNGVHFFDIATSKSGPRMVCFCTFWLGNVLRATTACNFSSLIWPAGSAPAALASLLFDPPEPQIIGKTQCFATFLPFHASASSFFLLFLFYSSFF